MEQFPQSLQYVEENTEIHSDLLAFDNAQDSSGKALFHCIKDVFIRLNIPMDCSRVTVLDAAITINRCQDRAPHIHTHLSANVPSPRRQRVLDKYPNVTHFE
ncbi:unnamed protein product [Boreogadus saida]